MRNFLFTIIFAVLLVGCARKVYVNDVPIRKTETVVVDSVRFVDSTRIVTSVKDSVRLKDSIVMKYDCQGNLLEREYYSLVERYNDKTNDYNELRELYANLESAKSDSVPVLVEVEKKLSRWEQFKVDYFMSALFGLGALFLIGLGLSKFRSLTRF